MVEWEQRVKYLERCMLVVMMLMSSCLTLSPHGTVLVFQPPEKGGARARKILNSEVLKNISAIFGLYITSALRRILYLEEATSLKQQ